MFKEYIERNQQNLIIRLSCLFWIFTKLFSYKLWHTDRLFPLIPPFDFLENIPNAVHQILFWTAILGITLILFFPKQKLVLAITICIEFCSCILDQNRWQPWEYQYFITLLFLFFYRQNPKQFLHYFAFMVIIIYVNSGLHKLNGGFLFHVWENMILRRFLGFESNQIQNIWIHYAGLLLGLIEVIASLGLLFFKKKKVFALMLIGMHLFILSFISPTGLNYNPIVWPWNIVMIMLIYILFCNDNAPQIVFKDLVSGYNKIPFLFLGILPIFCMFGLYDNFLSFNLYSGSLKQLDICIGNDKNVKQYAPFFSNKRTYCETGKVINTNVWTLREMNIVVYPEERVYFDIIKKWKAENPDSEASFYIYEYPYTDEFVTQYE